MGERTWLLSSSPLQTSSFLPVPPISQPIQKPEGKGAWRM
jgi:hypothetical protein